MDLMALAALMASCALHVAIPMTPNGNAADGDPGSVRLPEATGRSAVPVDK